MGSHHPQQIANETAESVHEHHPAFASTLMNALSVLLLPIAEVPIHQKDQIAGR